MYKEKIRAIGLNICGKSIIYCNQFRSCNQMEEAVDGEKFGLTNEKANLKSILMHWYKMTLYINYFKLFQSGRKPIHS